MRRGLSYMEVLIAAGIAVTGMLGVIAVFPVAILNMQKGQVVDVMAAAGPSALDNAKTLGVCDPALWLAHDNTSGEWRTAVALGPPAQGSQLDRIDVAPWAGICLD